MRTNSILCIATLFLFASWMPVASSRGRVPQTPDCDCTIEFNNFPLTIGGEGDLTESLSCVGNSPLYSCTMTGNITWTPIANCCAASGNWSNSNTSSGSADSCTAGFHQFTNCNGATSNPHSCQGACQPNPGTAISGWAVVRDCSGSSLGSALKQFRCIN